MAHTMEDINSQRHMIARKSTQTDSESSASSYFKSTDNVSGSAQKAKKRIQNRVAQRAYRCRMKQRIQYLEQQLYEMHAREQQAHYTESFNPIVADGSVSVVLGGQNISSEWQNHGVIPGSFHVQPLYRINHTSELFEEEADSWNHNPYFLSPTDSHIMSSSTWSSNATVPTEVSEDGIPTPYSALEERFAHVLECARRVGFETFDHMASQYYAQNFHAGSSLAMDQKVSRNRHLPAMLADLRRNSATWSVWERQGFQDETLKTAEEIYASECRDFKANGELVTLAAIQQNLPNVWAVLTRLASGLCFQQQGDRTNLVYSSIKLLCTREEITYKSVLDTD